MRRTLYEPRYFALISTTLLIWAGVATFMGRGGYGVAAVVALGMGLASSMPTFVLWRTTKLQGVALVISSLAFSLVSFPLAWFALYYVVRYAYATFVTRIFPSNWDLNVEAWSVIYQLPVDNIFFSVYVLTLAYVSACTTSTLKNKAMRISGLVLAAALGAYSAWFLVAAVVLAAN